MSAADGRAELARQQQALLRALVAGGPAPAGFSGAQVARAARALANKRRREAARAWPALARALGARFNERFAAFAAAVPPPAEGGPLVDGRGFARTLAASERTDELRLALLAFDLRWRSGAGGLLARRGPALRAAWLRRARRLAVGVRLPWLGPHVLLVPLGQRR
jgi:hypothetical protein